MNPTWSLGQLRFILFAPIELTTENCELEVRSQDVGREEVKHAGGKSVSTYIPLFTACIAIHDQNGRLRPVEGS